MRRAERLQGVAQHRSAATATAPAEEGASRPPLLPAEKNSHSAAAGAGLRKPRPRDVTSRYRAGTGHAAGNNVAAAAARCPSPTPATTTTPAVGAGSSSLPKRSQSAERRQRPATPSNVVRRSAPSSPASTRPSTPSSPASSTTRPSTPSSPVRGGRNSTPSNSRPSTPSSSRPSTPVRDSAVGTSLLSSRRIVSHRSVEAALWPSIRSLSSSFQSDSPSSFQTGSRTAEPKVKPTMASAIPERKRTPLRGRNSTDQSENSKPAAADNSHPNATKPVEQQRWPGISTRAARLLASSSAMTRSVDLGPSRQIQPRGISPRRIPSALTATTAKDVQKPVVGGGGASRRMSLDGLLRTDSDSSSSPRTPQTPPERPLSAGRPSRTMSLPASPAFSRPASPSKVSVPLTTSSSRGMSSPSRSRPSTPPTLWAATSQASLSNSALSYILDVRKGKKNAIEDVHQLRMLYNRQLQWRFVNARAEAALSIQRLDTEKALYNTWLAASELQYSVIAKKIEIIRLRQMLKLNIILENQMNYLEEWVSLEREHSNSLSGAIEALQASTVRLPVTGGARADFHTMKNALSSALDVMQAMGTSICYLLPRAEDTNSMILELATIATNERGMLDQCGDLLAFTTAAQVQESSLRTHLLQLSQDILNAA